MNQDDRFDEVVKEMAGDYNAPPPVPRDLMWERIQAARAASTIIPLHGRRVPTWTMWGIGLAAMLAIGIGIGRMTRVGSTGKGSLATTSSPPAVQTSSGQTTGVLATAPSDSAAAAPAPTVPGVSSSRTVRRDDGVKTPAPAQGNRLAAREGAKSSPDEVNVSAPRTGWRGDRPANSDAAALPYRLAAVQHLTRAEALLTSYEAEAKAGRQDDQMQAWSKDLLSTTRMLMDSPAGRDPKLRPLLEELELVLAQIQQATSSPGSTSDRDMVVEGMQKRGVLPRLRTAIPAGPTAGI